MRIGQRTVVEFLSGIPRGTDDGGPMTPERERLVRAVEKANATAMRCRLRYGRISEELAQAAIDAQSALTAHDCEIERRYRLWSKRQSQAQSSRRANEAERRTESARTDLAAYDAAHPEEAT